MNWVVAPQNCSTVGTYCEQGNLEPMDYLTLSAVAKVMALFRDIIATMGQNDSGLEIAF